MKKSILFLFSVLIIISSCTPKNSYQISGTAVNVNSDQLFLERLTQQTKKVVDTVSIVENGQFDLKGPIESPALFRLRNQNQQGVLLFLKPGSKVTIQMDFEQLQDYTISGNAESERIKEFNTFYTDRNVKKRELVASLNTEEDPEKKEELVNVLQQYDEETVELVKEKIKNEPSAIVGLLMIGAVPARENKKFYQEFNDRLQLELPDSDYAREFNGVIDQLNNMVDVPEVGDTVPDIEMPNPEGEVLKLSDLKGKYVLLDFWAAWCGPCRQENPNVVEAYNLYKDKGFTVFNVSLDKTKNAWVKAIEQDNLDWPYHVSDLKFWSNAAAKEYGVRSIPTNFLLDPDGKVIAKNLRGPALQEALAQIFNN